MAEFVLFREGRKNKDVVRMERRFGVHVFPHL
jgi:hypothetical protein